MAYDNKKNFAISKVVGAPSPATSGTSLAITTGDGTKFPTPPFNAIVWPANTQPSTTNAEIVRVTGIATDTLTMTRVQESTSARTITVGDQIMAGITAKSLTDIETGKLDLTGGTLTGLLNFSGTTHAGLQLNSLTTTQRDALTPSNGMTLYNTTLGVLQAYQSGSWQSIGKSSVTKTVALTGTPADYITTGTADDVVIQAAITAVSGLGGGTVHIRGGSYQIASPVTIPSNVTVQGDGVATVLTAASTLSTGSNMLTNSDQVSGNSYIVIKNLKLHGNYTNRGTAFGDETGSNIMFKKVTYGIVQNVVSTAAVTANIHLAQGAQNCVITENTAYGSSDHNILLVGTAAGATVSQNVIANNICYSSGAGAGQGVNIELAKYAINNVIIGNVCHDALEGGIHVFYRSNYNLISGNQCVSNTQNGISIVDESDYNIFTGNYIKGSGRAGISTTTAFLSTGGYYNQFIGNQIVSCNENAITGIFLGGQITNNFIDSCGAGVSATGNQKFAIYLPAVSDAVVANNRITNCADRGIEIDSAARCEVVNNYIGAGGSHALFFDSGSSCSDVVVSGNMIVNNPGAGIITLKNCTRFVVTGNVIKSCSGTNSGIDLRGATYFTVTGNSCVSNTGYGIKLVNDAQATPIACTYNIISNNTTTLNTQGGIAEQGAADHNIYVGNNTHGNTTANFAIVGANNEQGLNITT